MPNTPGWPTWSELHLLEKQVIAKNTAYIPVTFHTGSQPESDNIGELEKMAQSSLWLKLYGAPTTGNANDYEAADFRPIVAEWHRVAPDKPIGLHAGKDNLEDMIAMVAGEFGHALHIHHVSSTREIQSIEAAKDQDLPVTSGVCPHHLLKTDFDVHSEGWFARVQPSLTSADEADKLMDYLAKGTIDIIETDHAPHTKESKEKAEDLNPDGIHDSEHVTCFGLPCIELAAPLMFYQAKRGRISMGRVIEAMSSRPAELLGVKISPQTDVRWEMAEYRIGEDDVASKSGWTPYLGKLAMGRVVYLRQNNNHLILNGSIAPENTFTRPHPVVVKTRGTTI
jgi:hypothetical protein